MNIQITKHIKLQSKSQGKVLVDETLLREMQKRLLYGTLSDDDRHNLDSLISEVIKDLNGNDLQS